MNEGVEGAKQVLAQVSREKIRWRVVLGYMGGVDN
jgi:hypothetical protein